ncbi:phosphate ABC transporter permease PstA [soil metagenome]
MTPPPDSYAIGAGDGMPTLPIGGGTLPNWAPWGIVGGSAAIIAALLAALGSFSFPLFIALTIAASMVVTYAVSRTVESGRRAKDRLVTIAVASAFGIALTPLVSLLYQVIRRGIPAFDVAFFTETARGVVGSGGGAAHALVGTLVITGVATVVAVPIGIMTAIYMVEYGHGRLKRSLTFFVDVMTGIPSIVAGLFAVSLFTIFLGPGIRLGVIGSVALAVLMIPIVIRSSEEILKIIPNHLREASYALGTPKWKTIVKVVLPTALAGLITGVMLAVARIIGETAPLLVTAGTIDSINANPLSGRMENLAVFAFYSYKNPGVEQQASYDQAWTAALTLILIVMILSLAGRWVYRRFGTEIR